MTIVLDTSALLFWTLDPAKLTSKAAEAIAANPEKLVSAISLWEVGIKANRGTLRLPLSLRDYATRLATVAGLQILPVDVETWLTNIELPWDHRDPADRTIVATARLRNCPLVTSDATILAFYPAAIW